MTNTWPDIAFCPQQCWKMMLEKSEMKKLGSSANSSEVDKSSEGEAMIRICLDQDMNNITYITSGKENKIDISSIDCVSTDEGNSESFTVELKTKLKMNFVASSVTQAKYWVQGLQKLVANQENSSLGAERRDQWLRKTFQTLSTSDHHDLKYEDVYEKVLNCKHHFLTEDVFKQKLKEFLKKKKLNYKAEEGFFHLGNFVEFYKYVFDRKDIQNLFHRIASNGAFISITDLVYFLTKEQNESDVTHERCKEIIVTYEVTQVGREHLELNVDGFMHFVVSVDGQIFNPDHDHVYQDMHQPIPHYYIASSHNTYLCGKQLRGDSSVQAYSNVIEKGCRCVELDCWDGDDGEPIVYHGHTLTTKIFFKDIIKAIDNSAFKTSPYPLIVSLENHCSLEAQKKMALYMVEIFGDKMHTLPVDKTLGQLPSPEFFKHKILIRGKVEKVDDLKDDDENGVHSDLEQENEDKKNERERSKEKRNSKPELTSSNDGDGHTDVPAATASASQLTVPASSSTGRRRNSLSQSKKKVANELSELINHITNAKFISFDDSSKNIKFWQSSSFVEGDMLEHGENNATDFINFNRRQLSRVYPGGMRIDSSNYNPIKAWNVGCQIVALNHQTNDEPMALYYGKFRQNGRAGYVLKPAFLRDPSSKFNPNYVTKPNSGSKLLKMTIISGQQLPEQTDTWAFTKDEPDPYVQVQVFGAPVDEFTFTTSTYYDNSFNPTWNERFETKIHVPELAMVKFSVFDKDIGFDDFIGQSTLPFESLQQGYRHVALVDKEGVAIPCASIFVHALCEDLIQHSPLNNNIC